MKGKKFVVTIHIPPQFGGWGVGDSLMVRGGWFFKILVYLMVLTQVRDLETQIKGGPKKERKKKKKKRA